MVAGALFDGQGRVLITQRPPGKPLAGRWEFPGGKVGAGESEYAALVRELREELGVAVESGRGVMRLTHEYDDRKIELSMWLVDRYTGQPAGLDCQRLRWVAPERLGEEDILEADLPFILALQELATGGCGDSARDA